MSEKSDGLSDYQEVSMEIKNVFVVGSGLMGGGIAQVSAAAGYKVKMHDVEEKFTAKGLEAIKGSLGKFLSKEKITQEKHDAALANLSTTTDLADAADADIVVEAVFENLDVKKEVFGKLDEICPPYTILASNTSAIPISSIAAGTGRPDKVVGTHFFSPVPLMRLCEIIRGLQTSDETVETADSWAQSVGKETVRVLKDHAGFIANRLYLPMTCEAARMLEAGVASPEDIDKAMRMGYNLPMGPLELADMTGIDVLMNASTAIYNDTGDPKFYPPPLMRRMVAAGLLGRKTGKGYYDYSSGKQESYWKL
jgi:3-hydroxybutyryl-CoA dehydrogenase